ncbi:MAG: hypothetical protein HGA45_40240 [Chloroflexales bacterium]|nr:hypothetical protein [Chloroflexales bacterium]
MKRAAQRAAEQATAAAQVVTGRIKAITQLADQITEGDLTFPEAQIADALAELAFSHGFTRLMIRAIAIRIAEGASRP